VDCSQSDYNPLAEPLSKVQKIIQEALDKNSKSIQQQSDYESIVGEGLFSSIDEGQRIYPILDESSQEMSCIRGTMGIDHLEAVVSQRRFAATTG